MPGMRSCLCGLRQQVLFYMLLLTTSGPQVMANQVPSQVPSAEIDQRVTASLPTWHGSSAEIVDHLDLTRPFETRTDWTFVVAQLPGQHFSASSVQVVKGGPLAECFVDELTPRCKYAIPRNASSLSWFSTPLHFYSAKVVFAGAHDTEPILLVKTGSAYGGDGGHAIFTDLFAYDQHANRFKPVFSNSTGSNNNQETRFIEHGPLRGDVIVAVPTSTAPYAYRVFVYVRNEDGQYADLVLRYRSATRYGDRNPLPVIDSEMPNILERLGRWKAGDPLPTPDRLPSGCSHHFSLRGGEEWCTQ